MGPVGYVRAPPGPRSADVDAGPRNTKRRQDTEELLQGSASACAAGAGAPVITTGRTGEPVRPIGGMRRSPALRDQPFSSAARVRSAEGDDKGTTRSGVRGGRARHSRG